MKISDILEPKSDYSKQWVSREWQDRAKEFRRKHGAWCRLCRRADIPTHVHHINYLPGVLLADHPDDELTVFCEPCHKEWTKLMRAYRRLFSFWNVAELMALYGVLKVAKEKHGPSWPASKLMQALEKAESI